MSTEDNALTSPQKTMIIICALFLVYFAVISLVPVSAPAPTAEQLNCVQAQMALCEARGDWFCAARAKGVCGIR